MEIIILDGACMTSVEETHSYLARIMRFPAYYGGNLDALADCLSGLGSHVTVRLKNESTMQKQLGDYADKLLEVFQETSSEMNAFCWQMQAE